VIRFTPLAEGDIDLLKFIRMLKEKGYKGVISMEDEFEEWTTLPQEKVIEILKRDIDYLRSAFSNLNLLVFSQRSSSGGE